jgi:hypothetical protein
MDDATRAWLRDRVGAAVRAGIDGDDAVMALAAEIVWIETGARDEGDLREARGDAAALIAERDAVERAWTAPTTNDAIDAAFAELERCGIVAIQRAGDTLTEGWTVADELAAARPGTRGAVFYHAQDLDRALAGEGLLLAFAAYAPDDRLEEESAGVARETCEALTRRGVEVSWDGDTSRRIRIAPFEWRKRRRAVAP